MELNAKRLFPEVENSELLKHQLITKKDLLDFSKMLIDEVHKISQAVEPQKQWLRSGETRKLLNISAATLQNLRVNGTLKPTQVGSIYYYKYEEIQKVLNP